MATTYKVLGQAMPTDTNNINLYTVPANTSLVASTLSITNVSDTSVSATCCVYVRVAGAAAAKSNALVYKTYIQANDVNPLTIGITAGAGDIITVQSSVASTLTFQLFGSENS